MRANVSLGRINNFIQDTEQLDDKPVAFSRLTSNDTSSNEKKQDSAVRISNAKFRFSRYGSTGFTLVVDDLKIPKNATTIIAGDVGSGKSAFLLALLGELHVRSGKVDILTNGGERIKTSYAAQSPWLQGKLIPAFEMSIRG